MRHKDFLEFLIHHKAPPAILKASVKRDIALSFHTKTIILRFLGHYLIGALFSMSICPQFGLGLIDGHGITHHLRMIGDWACAAFCGALFLSSGMVISFLGMKGEELWWVWRRFKYSLIFLPTISWALLMLANRGMNLPPETLSYHLTWVIVAMLAQAIWFKIRSFTYTRDLLGSRSY